MEHGDGIGSHAAHRRPDDRRYDVIDCTYTRGDPRALCPHQGVAVALTPASTACRGSSPVAEIPNFPH